MGFSSASIKQIDNGYVLRIDYALNATEEYYKDPVELIERPLNALSPTEEDE